MIYPEITILVQTYKRYDDIQQTLDSLMENLIYPRDRLRWLIADDASGDGYPHNLADIPRYQSLNLRFTTLSRNGGYGANRNNGLSSVDTPLTYVTEDDWVLCNKLDLRAGAGLLETKPDIGVVRYGGTAGDMVYHYRQYEVDVSEYVKENIHATDYIEGKLTYLVIDVESPSLYVYSGRPQLGKLRWYYDLGLFSERARLGECENDFAHKVKRYLREAPFAQQIAILPDWINMKYRHIGQTFQGTAIDVEHSGA